MAATKTAGVWVSNATSCAASGTVTSSTLSVSGSYGGVVTAQIINGSSAPTVPCSVTLNASEDGGTNWRMVNQSGGGIGSSGSYPVAFDVPPGLSTIQLVFTGNTGNAVSVQAQYHFLAGL